MTSTWSQLDLNYLSTLSSKKIEAGQWPASVRPFELSVPAWAGERNPTNINTEELGNAVGGSFYLLVVRSLKLDLSLILLCRHLSFWRAKLVMRYSRTDPRPDPIGCLDLDCSNCNCNSMNVYHNDFPFLMTYRIKASVKDGYCPSQRKGSHCPICRIVGSDCLSCCLGVWWCESSKVSLHYQLWLRLSYMHILVEDCS